VNENAKLEVYLQENKRQLEDATQKMIKTTRDIEKFRALQIQSDAQLDKYIKENELLKNQVATFSQQLMSRQNQESSIMITIEERVKEYKEMIQDKDNEIRQLQDLCISLEDQIKKFRMDSDKSLVANMLKAIQRKDKEIEILKEKVEECATEMDKSSAVINSLTKTAHYGSHDTKNTPSYLLHDAEQKIKFLENMLRDNQDRLRECEEHAVHKEKELVEALNRLEDYETGDYQLQQAVTEIKNLKTQLKIRDRDIEDLTKHINKLDYVLNDVLEEDDELRAKLGMDPREPLDLNGFKELKVIKAQESRAIVHVLKKEIENLEEDRIRLKEQVRKLAKLAGKKDIDRFLEEEEIKSSKTHVSYRNEIYDSKLKELTLEVPKETLIEVDELRRKNESLLKLQQKYQDENKQLEQGLKEVLDQIKNIKVKGTKGSDVIIQCPILEKLLNVIFHYFKLNL
jgi:centrosomal protein CEP290